MKITLLTLCMIFVYANAMANDKVTSVISQYAWEQRQLIVFSPSIDHKQYQLFKRFESEYREDFKDRKLHTWHVIDKQPVLLQSVIRDDINTQEFRNAYNIDKDEFQLILIGYDQEEKLRQNKIDIQFLFSRIDQMPMRQQEMREQ